MLLCLHSLWGFCVSIASSVTGKKMCCAPPKKYNHTDGDQRLTKLVSFPVLLLAFLLSIWSKIAGHSLILWAKQNETCGCSLAVGYFSLFLLQLISFSIYFVLTKYKRRALYCFNDKQETHSLCRQAMLKPLGLSHLENKSSTLAQTLNILFIQLIHENSIQLQRF